MVRGLPYWICTLMCRGRFRTMKFSVGALGERRAKLCAQRQRLAWMVEEGIFCPTRHDDPHGCLAEPLARVKSASDDEVETRGMDFEGLAQMCHRFIAA